MSVAEIRFHRMLRSGGMPLKRAPSSQVKLIWRERKGLGEGRGVGGAVRYIPRDDEEAVWIGEKCILISGNSALGSCLS